MDGNVSPRVTANPARRAPLPSPCCPSSPPHVIARPQSVAQRAEATPSHHYPPPRGSPFDIPVTHYVTYSSVVILSFRDKRTRDFADGKRVKAFDGIRRAAEMKLDQVDAATSIRDLALPGNRLEALKGVRKGQHSIRINDQWRVCFEWRQGAPGPSDVEIVDYH